VNADGVDDWHGAMSTRTVVRSARPNERVQG
jgi:hypothetical protein